MKILSIVLVMASCFMIIEKITTRYLLSELNQKLKTETNLAKILNPLGIRPNWKPESDDHNLQARYNWGQCVDDPYSDPEQNWKKYAISPYDNCNYCDCRWDLLYADPFETLYLFCITRSCTNKHPCRSFTKEEHEVCDTIDDNCNKTA